MLVREMKNIREILVGKPEWKRLLERPVSRWEDIKTDITGNRMSMWTELTWLRIGSSDGPMWTQ
jgi:hypothetical protein